VNVFNRLVVIILLLAIIVLVIVVAVVPRETFSLTGAFVDWMHRGTEDYMSGSQWPLFAAGRVFIGGAIVLVCLFLLWLELRRPRKKTVRVQKTAGGEVHIAVDSIAQRLAYNIDQLPDVVKVTPRITSRSRGVDIDLLLETSPDIDVPMKTEEVLEVTREVVVDRMGLKLGNVQVKIKHAPFPRE
jgi:hypothetical protein